MEDLGSGSGGTGFPGLSFMTGANGHCYTSVLKNTTGGTDTGDTTDHRESFRLRSDLVTLSESDDPLLESNDEGIGTGHLNEKMKGEISVKDLEHYIDTELIEVANKERN